MSENAQIEVQIPEANRAEEWNAAMRAGAEKAGVEIPGVTAAPKTEDKKKDDTEEKVYRASLTVNGKEVIFEDKDPAQVLKQYTAAVEAAQLASAPAAAKVEEKKPGITDAEMFDVKTKIMAGDTAGLDLYLEKSGVLDRWFESKGLNVEQIKAATAATQTNQVHDDWKAATDQFIEKVKAGQIDFPGGQQNMKMMGYTLARLGLKPSLESMEKAWATMKEDGLVFPAAASPGKTEEKKTETVKTATSSTAIGTAGAGKENQTPAIDPNRKFEIDMTKISVAEASRSWNELIAQGVKPEQIVVKR